MPSPHLPLHSRQLPLFCISPILSLSHSSPSQWICSRTHHSLSALPAPLANGLTALLRAPRLRKLHIQHWNFENDVQALHRMLSLCSASLECLALIGVSCNSSAIVHDLSTVRLAALSTLRLHYVKHPGLTEASIRCPNLRSMEMGIEDGRLFFPSDVENLNLTGTLPACRPASLR